MTTRIDRLKEKLAKIKKQYLTEMANFRPMKAIDYKVMIDKLEKEIAEAESYLPKKLADQLPAKVLDESGLCNLIIKTHMAADFLCDTAFILRAKMQELGFADCSLYPFIERLEKDSATYAGIACHEDFAGLSDFMTTNEVLIEKLHKTCDAYLKKHLKITFEEDAKD